MILTKLICSFTIQTLIPTFLYMIFRNFMDVSIKNSTNNVQNFQTQYLKTLKTHLTYNKEEKGKKPNL